jgi:hypothetical protein
MCRIWEILKAVVILSSGIFHRTTRRYKTHQNEIYWHDFDSPLLNVSRCSPQSVQLESAIPSPRVLLSCVDKKRSSINSRKITIPSPCYIIGLSVLTQTLRERAQIRLFLSLVGWNRFCILPYLGTWALYAQICEVPCIPAWSLVVFWIMILK